MLGSIFRVDAMAIGKLVGTLKTKSPAGTWRVGRNHRLADACDNTVFLSMLKML